MNSLTVVIRTNGGDRIGLGHIRRCLSLAQALTRQGATVLFVTNDDKAALALVCENGFETTPVQAETDFEQTRRVIDHRRAPVLVVDSYDIDADYLRSIREHVGLLVAVDDIANRRLPVDIVINGAAYAAELAYDVLPHTMLLLGTAYMILRKEFAQEPPRKLQGPIRRILITLGGSDPRGLTQRLVEWIWQENREIDLDVIVGPFFKNVEPIFEAVAQTQGHARVYCSPTDMRTLMLAADVAVTGGGQTTYELAATATPAVAISTAENQLRNLESLTQAGSLAYAGRLEDLDLREKLSHQLRLMFSDPLNCYEMGRRGRKLVDGSGAERVAAHLIEQMPGQASMNDKDTRQIRPCNSRDMQLLWEWANDPSVRMNSLHAEPIPWESHSRWYNAHLLSPDTCFWILEKSGEPIGQIRYDKNCENDSAQISFSVAKKYRGQGYGAELISRTRELARMKLGVGRITAVTFVENAASARVFTRQGFKQLGSALIEGRQCYQFCWEPTKEMDSER